MRHLQSPYYRERDADRVRSASADALSHGAVFLERVRHGAYESIGGRSSSTAVSGAQRRTRTSALQKTPPRRAGFNGNPFLRRQFICRDLIVVILALSIALCWTGQSIAASPAPTAPLSGPADGSAQTNVRVVVPRPNHSPVDAEAIRRPSTAAVSGNSSVPTSQGLELSRVGAALAIVIALILGLRWGGKKLFGPTVMGHSTRAVQVLARSPVSARQSILLVRVGRRVLVVGDSGAQMNRLTEITDPDEVASLVGQLRDEQPGYSAGAFGKLFHRAAQDMNDEGNESVESHDERAGISELATGDGGIDPAIHETREELTGLMEKIRSLSQNFPSRSVEER